MKRSFLFPLFCIPLVFMAFMSHFSPENIQNVFCCISLLYIISGYVFYRRHDTAIVIYLIFLLGFTLKLFYIAYTPYWLRQHDAGNFANDGERGHFEYIYYILTQHTFPFFHQTPDWPIYHPPLHYLISALFLSICSGYENLQYLSFAYTGGCCIVSYLCFSPWIKNDNIRILTALFCSFFPAFIYLSGALNNDPLSAFLSTLSVFYFMRYLQNKKRVAFVLSAVFLGLAGMTKVSTVMLFIGILLFYIVSTLTERIKPIKALKKIAVFSFIYLALFSIWPLYIRIRWGELSIFSSHYPNSALFATIPFWLSEYNPFLHIADMTFANISQFVGSYSLLERFGPIFYPFSIPFILKGYYYSEIIPEYNFWIALLKDSLFSEISLFRLGASMKSTIGFDLCVLFFATAQILFVFFCFAFFKVDRKNTVVLYCQSIIMACLAALICFCLRNPIWSACSFRYIIPVFPCCCLIVIQYVQDNLSADIRSEFIKNFFAGLIIFFSLTSFLVYSVFGSLSF